MGAGSRLGWVVAVACCGGLGACGQPAQAPAESPLQRGEYLVTRVGMCVDCHSPRKDGHPDPARSMTGATIGFAPLGPVPGWQAQAPALAGLGDYSADEIVKILTTGLGDDGKPPRPPMPPYRMTEADARAVVAYLQSLKAP